jgi:murein DD-endopeptidase MepM/ murein hydrolase activator NlpD
MGLEKPVEGPLSAGFAPTGRFSGHWGVDWAVPEDTEIRSAGSGTVTFAGSVAGNQAVTVDHGGGLRTSYSYLAGLSVERGDQVAGSTILGTSGAAHGSAALHFSVRIGDTYLDPLAVVGCRWAAPSAALRLVPVRELE